MGFKTGAYATVWGVEAMNERWTKLRLTVSRKIADSDQYEQTFSGFVSCLGTAAAEKALKLKKRDRIQLGDCDVTTKYDAEKNVTYTNFSLYSFDLASDDATNNKSSTKVDTTDPQPDVDDGQIDDNQLPF